LDDERVLGLQIIRCLSPKNTFIPLFIDNVEIDEEDNKICSARSLMKGV
jgi:hypothetical protein